MMKIQRIEERSGVWNLVLCTVFGLGLLAASSARAQQSSPPPEVLAYADMVLYNGQVLTVDDSFTIGQAVAVREGKFLAVGASDRIRAMAGPKTRQIDLKGRTVTPGFIDTHFHLHEYGTRGLEPSISFKSREQWLADFKKLLDGAAPGEWIIGSSSESGSASNLPVTVKDLDPLSPNNPVYLSTSPGDGIVNSYALRLAKLPDDAFGLEKDPKTGEPTGRVSQWAWGTISREIVPFRPMETLMPMFKAAMAKFNVGGMTTVLSRLPGESVSVFKNLWERGELTMRVRVAHEFSHNTRNVEAIIKRVGNLNGFGDDWMKISGANVGNPDGTLSGGRGWTRKPKLGTNDYGFAPYYEDHERSDWKTIQILNRFGWRILGIHTAGDRGLDELLSAFEAANKEKSIVGRGFAFDHVIMVKPEHIEIAKRLGIIASAAPKYIAASADRLSKLYGADEVYKMSPIKSLLDAGVRVVMEADDAENFWPMWNIEKFVTRMDDTGKVWNPQERINREQALYMYTNWAADYTGDTNLGTIEPGKLADFVVLDGDFMKVPDVEISKLKVLMTVVGGKVVFEKGM